jgi:hypothetical protein
MALVNRGAATVSTADGAHGVVAIDPMPPTDRTYLHRVQGQIVQTDVTTTTLAAQQNPGGANAYRLLQADGSATERQQAIMMVNPALLHVVDLFQQPQVPVPASQIHKPTLLCVTSPPNDQTQFQDPDVLSKRYSFGGGFRIATAVDGVTQRKWVEFRPDDDGKGYTLEVHLNSQTPTPMPGGVEPIPASVPVTMRCFLQANVSGSVMTWDFGQVAVSGSVWTLTLQLTGDSAMADRDKIYAAMTKPPYAQLVIRRSLSLATLLPPPGPPYWLSLAGGGFVRRQMDGTADTVPTADEVRAAAGSAGAMIMRPPQPKPPQPMPLYRVAVSAIDSSVNFAFDPVLDQAVFAKLTGVGTSPSGWNRFKLLWQPDAGKPGTWHNYYQDRSQPRAIYFLPDEFLVQRRPASPHRPWLNLSILEDGSKISLGYVAVPVWDAARTDAATSALKATNGVPADLPALQPFAAGNATLRMNLPKGDPSGGPGFVAQPAASVQTDSAINGNVTLSVDDFKPVFDALVSDDSALLMGKVDVVIDGQTTSIDFTARASRFTGPVLDVDTAADATSGGIALAFRNAIESPVLVSALPVTLNVGQQPVPTQLVSVAPPFDPKTPTKLLAGPNGQGEAINLVVARTAPKDPPAGDSTAAWDVSQVAVQPDGDALLNTILDASIDAHSVRDVKVNLPTVLFKAPSGAPPPPAGTPPAPDAIAIQVEFEAGPTAATFYAPQASDTSPLVNQVVHLRTPLRDFLSGQLSGTASQYRYRVRKIYATDDHLYDTQTDDRDEMFVTLPPGA